MSIVQETEPKIKAVTWAALVEVALCDDLDRSTRLFAVDELRRLAAYLDDQLYFARCGDLDVTPFSVGRPVRDVGGAEKGGVRW